MLVVQDSGLIDRQRFPSTEFSDEMVRGRSVVFSLVPHCVPFLPAPPLGRELNTFSVTGVLPPYIKVHYTGLG